MSLLKTLIFSDLDGTLLDHFTYDFTPAKSTIAQLNAINIPIVLTTSKTFAEVNLLQKKLAISAPVIIENGAAIYIPKSTFQTQPKDTTSMDSYWVKSFCSPREHWLNIIANAPACYEHSYRGFSSLSTEELMQITGLTQVAAQLAKNRQYGEPIHWLGNDVSKYAFIEHLEKAGAKVLQGGRFFHVSGHCNKGKALAWLTQQYQTTLGDKKVTTIALGDGENDVAMLEVATIAVQVFSPVHPFPLLPTQTNIFKTKQCGPAGWVEAIQNLLSTQLSLGSQTYSIKREVNHG